MHVVEGAADREVLYLVYGAYGPESGFSGLRIKTYELADNALFPATPFVLKGGADPAITNSSGDTAVSPAREKNRAEAVRRLEEAGIRQN